MKKMLLTLAALALSAAAIAQDIDFEELDGFNKIEISSGSRVETELGMGLPMYFGWTSLTEANANPGGPWARMNTVFPGTHFDVGKSFMYGLQLVDMHVRYKMLDLSLGLRWTFMDFTFKNSAQTMRKKDMYSGSYSTGEHWAWWPVPIESEAAKYDGKKSKIHASYFGVPLRVGLDFGSAEVYVGASIEMLTEGYTKYKRPRDRQKAKDLFNPVRATVEGGFSYGNLGIFVMYGLTPLFSPDLSDAKTLTFGLLFGL